MKNLTTIALLPILTLTLTACGGGEQSQNGVKLTEPVSYNGINFGIDGSEWSNDFECDDPRFVGIGMTETDLLTPDTRMDATDCMQAYKAGNIKLK